ncbi:riboflavin synthase [Conchiformibius steedae DSM 2580]|uniref:Riboflavin synthase n=1 Tax=Conchiformibius steedae DSM 2580 TaxID=1121352 RepID=A0AAE9KXX2_9NEIS|nr:riboflavin synthase [Conchiformibius steedae]QMT34177.1 riboflavin synthase [Conchiformibius steedae]URD66952.1 riboflavin synthase [Conchiformibius steedae DSM 2580]
MFTGIVAGMGVLEKVQRPAPDFCTFHVRLPEGMGKDLTEGASVAHNGCCLTVTAVQGDCAQFDLMAETLAKTNLGGLQEGSRINIERAARIGDEIGGHLMSGHIWGQTEVLAVEHSEHNCTVWLALPEALRPYVLPKGFVGLDGCSLTVGEVRDDAFCVYLIPETLRRTRFSECEAGMRVNMEIDPQTQAVVDSVKRVLAAQQL